MHSLFNSRELTFKSQLIDRLAGRSPVIHSDSLIAKIRCVVKIAYCAREFALYRFLCIKLPYFFLMFDKKCPLQKLQWWRVSLCLATKDCKQTCSNKNGALEFEMFTIHSIFSTKTRDTKNAIVIEKKWLVWIYPIFTLLNVCIYSNMNNRVCDIKLI